MILIDSGTQQSVSCVLRFYAHTTWSIMLLCVYNVTTGSKSPRRYMRRTQVWCHMATVFERRQYVCVCLHHSLHTTKHQVSSLRTPSWYLQYTRLMQYTASAAMLSLPWQT